MRKRDSPSGEKKRSTSKDRHRKYAASRSRSRSQSPGGGGGGQRNFTNNYQQFPQHRYNKEEHMARRVQQRTQMKQRKNIWDFSTDEEDYLEDVAVYWTKQDKEKALIEKEQKEEDERKRIAKVKRIQKGAGADGSDNEGDNDIDGNDSNNNSSGLDSDGNKKKNLTVKRKAIAAATESDEDNSSDDEDSTDSFAELCREKINGPDPKKAAKRLKRANNKPTATAAATTTATATATAAADNAEMNDDYPSALDNDAAIQQMMEEEDHNSNSRAFIMDNVGTFGPMPQMLMENKRDVNYTGLMPGEGDAIAHYVEEGKRIPRRGEVGLTSEQIQRFEDLGYVMSGSRHKRMNAVREMKEAKVISQQEKKAMAIYNYQQKNKTEVRLGAYFKSMLDEKLEESRRREAKE